MKNIIKKYSILLFVFCFQSIFSVNAQTKVFANDANIVFRGVLYPKKSADSVVLNRFDPAVFKDATFKAHYDTVKARTQSGVVLSFRTASPNLTVNFTMTNNSSRNASCWAIYKDGVFQSYKTSGIIVLTSGTTQATTWDIVLPILHGDKFTGLTLDNGYTTLPIPTENKKQYLAIGNSITHGVGQQTTIAGISRNSASDSTYAFQLAKNMGWRLYNLAVGGSSITPIIADQTNPAITKVNADIITVLWGFNDWNLNRSMVTLAVDYKSLLTKLRGYHPNAKIYCIMPTFTSSTVPQYFPPAKYTSIDTLRNTERRVVKSLIAAGDKQMYIIAGDSITKLADLNDAVHLNTKGAYSFAQNLTSAIQKIEGVLISIPTIYDNSSLAIFPNPIRNNVLNIVSKESINNAQLSVSDLCGKTICSQKIENVETQKVQLHVDTPLKGVFCVKISSSAHNYSKLLTFE